MLKRRPSRGRRGFDEDALLDAALQEMERRGVEGFSLRAVARSVGCDAAALIYRFGSKEGLQRAVADRLHARTMRPDPKLPWRIRLSEMARQYRVLAQTYPNSFALLMRYWATGPQDLKLAEDAFAALCDAGIPDHLVPAVECGFYAALLGLCAGDAGGVTGRPDAATMKEIRLTDELSSMHRLLPAINRLKSDAVFETGIRLLLDGIEVIANDGKPKQVRAATTKRARRRSG